VFALYLTRRSSVAAHALKIGEFARVELEEL
jgi:hypothetical protein